jgi:uncharacterized protein (TIGR00730 family)
MQDRKIAIFCSASKDIDPKYNQAARELVRGACSLGYTIVSGGTVKGMMGVVGDEVVKCGGRHIGVIPRFMKDLVYPDLSEIVWTDTMDERKSNMRKGASAAIALPGGIGTLDELVGTFTDAKLGQFHGKVYALNIEGFYKPLISLFDYYVSMNMLDVKSRQLVEFPSTVEELLKSLSKL